MKSFEVLPIGTAVIIKPNKPYKSASIGLTEHLNEIVTVKENVPNLGYIFNEYPTTKVDDLELPHVWSYKTVQKI